MVLLFNLNREDVKHSKCCRCQTHQILCTFCGKRLYIKLFWKAWKTVADVLGRSARLEPLNDKKSKKVRKISKMRKKDPSFEYDIAARILTVKTRKPC